MVLRNGEALEKDAAAYAEAFNVSRSEALRRLRLQPAIGDLDKMLSQKWPETYAGLWITNGSNYEVKVGATGNLDGYRSLVKQTPFGNEVTVIQEEKSLRTLRSEHQAAIAYLQDQNIDSESEVNVRQNRVDVFVHDKSEGVPSTNLLAPASAAISDLNFIEVPQFSQPFVDMYAGLRFVLTGRGVYCTSAYTMYTASRTFVSTTAAHCEGTLDHQGTPLTIVDRNFGGSFDIEHVRGSGFVYKPWARDNEPTSGGTPYYREISRAYNRVDTPIGTWVCKYGQSLGHRCGELATRDFRPSDFTGFPDRLNAPTFMRLDRVGTTQIAAGGDSGGPVYMGHAALGLIHGGFTNNCGAAYLCGDMIYMAANFMTQFGKYEFAVAP